MQLMLGNGQRCRRLHDDRAQRYGAHLQPRFVGLKVSSTAPTTSSERIDCRVNIIPIGVVATAAGALVYTLAPAASTIPALPHRR